MALFGKLFGKKKEASRPAAPGRATGIFGGHSGRRLFERRASPRATGAPFGKPVALPQPITTGRKIKDADVNAAWYQGRGPYGTSEGAEQVLPRGSEYEEAFLNGTLNYVTSSVIASGQYDRGERELTLTFRPETTLRTTVYEGVSEDEAIDFFVAGSKGRWWHQVCLGPGWTPGGGTAKSWHFA